jgi:hypothetical protein
MTLQDSQQMAIIRIPNPDRTVIPTTRKHVPISVEGYCPHFVAISINYGLA